MTYGKIDYDNEGKPICAICGKGFDRLGFHVWISHDMTAKEYKKMFGLDTKKGLTSERSRIKSREAVHRNYDKVVAKNLLKNGERTRFYKGHKGRTKDQVSEQTKERLRKHIGNISPTIKKNLTCNNINTMKVKTKKELQEELDECKKLLKDVHELSLRIKWSPSEVSKWIEVEKQLGIKSDEFAF